MLCETKENSKAIFWLRNNILWPAAVTATERENCQPWHGELCQIEQTIEKVYIEWHGELCQIEQTIEKVYIEWHGELCQIEQTIEKVYTV